MDRDEEVVSISLTRAQAHVIYRLMLSAAERESRLAFDEIEKATRFSDAKGLHPYYEAGSTMHKNRSIMARKIARLISKLQDGRRRKMDFVKSDVVPV